jgi:4-hydroxy-3-polyprenylbenzoate decarboxylase
MAYESYREFVEALDRAGELKRIVEPVATELEITELADREMKAPGGGKALLIEQPTVNGERSPFPVAINTMGSWKRMALALGADSVEVVAAELGSLMKAKPPTGVREALKLLGTAVELRHAKPKLVKTGPCKQVIHRFDVAPVRTDPWPAASHPTEGDPVASEERQRAGNGRIHATLLDLPMLQCWPWTGAGSSPCRAW